jgi:hypothetical protein
MNILYKNNIFFFKNNDIEKNVLFLETRDRHKLEDLFTESIVNLYLSKKRYGCSYSTQTEELITKYFKK